ncbi:MAG: hypothetical protein ACTHN0_03800 [Aquihabitans sp.]
MIRRRNAILLALGLLAPLALVDSPAGAALDQDLVASTTSGPPGTSIVLSSASCTASGGGEAYLEASLYIGTAPAEQIAAYGTGFEGSVTLTIPDWVDTSQPATIEAACDVWSEDGNDDDSIQYDPIAFTLEAGSGTPVQVRSYSRTELLAGQAILVTGSCGPALADSQVYGLVGSGTDQAGRAFDVIAGEGYTETDGDGNFELPLYLSNAYVGFRIEDDGSSITDIKAAEEPMNIPAGDYTSFVYCSTDSDSESSSQFLEPQLLDITGSAPTGDIDLTNAAGTRNVTLAGTSTAGDVNGSFQGISTDELLGGFSPDADPSARLVRSNRFAAARTKTGAGKGLRAVLQNPGGSNRVVDDGDYVEFNATTGADGAWQATDAAGFDKGIIIAMATAGDPFADGYVYDPQGVDIAVIEPTTTTTVTVPVTTPAPANAVPGTPTYAG